MRSWPVACGVVVAARDSYWAPHSLLEHIGPLRAELDKILEDSEGFTLSWDHLFSTVASVENALEGHQESPLTPLFQCHDGSFLSTDMLAAPPIDGGILGHTDLPADFPSRFAHFQALYMRDSLSWSRRFVALMDNEGLTRILNWCPGLILDMMMNTLLALEADQGFAIAKEAYVRLMQLSEELVSDGAMAEESLLSTASVSPELLKALLVTQRAHQDALTSGSPEDKIQVRSAIRRFLTTNPELRRRALNGRLVHRLRTRWKTVDIARTYPILFGLEELPQTESEAHCLGQKFYVYPIHEIFSQLSRLSCSYSQWGTEVLFALYFEHNRCRTLDPEDADWFFVPGYFTCRYRPLSSEINQQITSLEHLRACLRKEFRERKLASIVEGHIMEYERIGDLLFQPESLGMRDATNAQEDDTICESLDDIADREIFQKAIRNTLIYDERGYFARRRGADHIFLFADGQGPRLFGNFLLLQNCVFLSVEATCPGWTAGILDQQVDVYDCLDTTYKDLVIPGLVTIDRARALERLNKRSEERNYVFTFHGRHPESSQSHAGARIRGQILDLFEGMPGVSVSGFVSDYFEKKGDSHFCLVPGGTSPWTIHLYESFFAGCIPIILSDEYQPAFITELPFHRFSIKWPEAEVHKLYKYLTDLVERNPILVKRMKLQLDTYRCYFDYFSDTSGCSPFVLLQKGLRRRLEARRKAAPAANYWRPDVKEDKFFEALDSDYKDMDSIPWRYWGGMGRGVDGTPSDLLPIVNGTIHLKRSSRYHSVRMDSRPFELLREAP